MAILQNIPPIKVYWDNRAPVFVARVNIPGTITYPIQEIPFDGVTIGAYTDLAADMFFTLGSAAGLDDLGRGRLRAAPTATLLKVGRSSQGYEDGELAVEDNAFVSVYDDYRVHAKIATIGTDSVEYKDSDLAVGDLTQFPPPIANMGPDRARSIDADSGLARFYFDSSGSFAVADGATIVSVAWEIGDGAYALGTGATDSDIFVDFGAGVRYVSLTVTDSNGKTNTTRRLVLADDPDDSLCVSGMQVENITRTRQGCTARLRLLQDLPRADYPDGGKVLIWEDRDPAIYGTPDPADFSDLLFTGWHQVDQASSAAFETHLQRETSLTCVDVAGRLDSLPGLHQRIELPEEGDEITWGIMPAPNLDKFFCYLLHWGSTAAGVADFFPSGTWDEYPFVIFDAPDGSLYEQLQRQANRFVPDHNFAANPFGQLQVIVDPNYQDPADRTATVQGTLTEASWQEISFGYQRTPRVRTLRGSALLTATAWTFDDDGNKELATAFSIAPGTAPSQGAQEQTLGERLAKSQADLNRCVGHHLARLNARYGPVTVALNSNYDPHSIDPAAMTWIGLVTTAATAPQRTIGFATARTLPTEVSIDYSYGEEATTVRARLTLELETAGLPALTEAQDAALPVGDLPLITIPPDMGLVTGQELIAAIGSDGYRYKTADFQTPSGSGGPTWTRDNLSIAATIYSWVVDPFSPGYAPGATSGAVNGWIVNDTDIYRVTDLHGTTVATSILTFPVATSGAAFHWRTVQASFGAFFAAGVNPWLVCVSYYGDTSGHEGTWATYSVDGGVTWADEVQISALYDAATPARFNPIAVFASPRTPGKALTAAVGSGSTGALPRWVVYDDETDTITSSGLGASKSITSTSTAGPVVDQSLWIAPPPNTKRMVVTGTWAIGFASPGGGACASVVDVLDAVATSLTDDLTYTEPSPNTSDGSTSGSFTATFTFASFATLDWPVNTSNYASAANSDASRFRARADTTGTAICTTTVSVRVTEIELDDGTIYNPSATLMDGFVSTDWGASWSAMGNVMIAPGRGFAGTLHFPWEGNLSEQLALYGNFDDATVRQFRLMSANGASVTDISPDEGGVLYGVNRGSFGVRAYDSDRQHLLLAGIGNDTSNDSDDDLHGVFYSSDYGATWTTIVAPIADSGAPTNRPAFEAAFGNDDSDVILIWGPPDYIATSSDAGATVDDRSGNLSGFSVPGLIGIAGGPTP